MKSNYSFLQRPILIAIIAALALIITNKLLSNTAIRWDLTHDKRYTLSETAVELASKLDEPFTIDVLLEGNLPPEYERLRQEVRQVLIEFQRINSNLKFDFVDPFEDVDDVAEVAYDLQRLGLKPIQTTRGEAGKISQELIVPWAVVNKGTQTVAVPLLRNLLGSTEEERINQSIGALQYAFADAFFKLSISTKKKVAVLTGINGLPEIQMADYLSQLSQYYDIYSFAIDSIGDFKKKLQDLSTYDLAIIAKPRIRFTEVQKYLLDQFLVAGKGLLWMVDASSAEKDSLYSQNGRIVAFPNDLNLEDLFFRYGLRLETGLVRDLYCAPIVVATEEGRNSNYSPIPWVYDPIAVQMPKNPISERVGNVRFEFVNTIDTLLSPAKKSILLYSSELSDIRKIPTEIDLRELSLPQDPNRMKGGPFNLAILMEGTFRSAYLNRVKPISGVRSMDSTSMAKMIVIADGDVVKNQLREGRPLELGYDKWTNSFYNNKEFLLNSAHYLMGDKLLLSLKARDVTLVFLDKDRVDAYSKRYKILNLLLPWLLILISGWFFRLWRKRRYVK